MYQPPHLWILVCFRCFSVRKSCHKHSHTHLLVHMCKIPQGRHLRVEPLIYRICASSILLEKWFTQSMSSDYILTIWHYWTLKFLAISRYKTVSHCGFNLHFPDSNENVHFFRYLLATKISSSINYLFVSFVNFSTDLSRSICMGLGTV